MARFHDFATGPQADTALESSLVLLERAQEGDAEAVERLCQRFLPRLRRWATGRLPPKARHLIDTDDLVQETLVRTLGRLEDFVPRSEGALHVYLRQAVLNRLRDEGRKSGRRPTAVEFEDGHPHRGPSPLEEVVGREALARYEAGLARLRPKDREAVILRAELGYSYREIAQATKKPTDDAARMAVSRALLRLAREMSDGE